MTDNNEYQQLLKDMNDFITKRIYTKIEGEALLLKTAKYPCDPEMVRVGSMVLNKLTGNDNE